MFPIRIANATVRFNARMFRFYLADVKVRDKAIPEFRAPGCVAQWLDWLFLLIFFLAGNGEEVRLRQQDKKIIFINNLSFIKM